MRFSTCLLAIGIPLALVAPAANADVVISSAATQNMMCSAGVCAPTATDAVLDVSDLESLLASGNVEVTTTGSGNIQANNIDVDAALSWSTASTLALDADSIIAVNEAIAVGGPGGLSLTYGVTRFACTLAFGKAGSASFANLSSQLTINNTSYTLVSDLKSLASVMKSNPSGAYALANDFDASHDGAYGKSPVDMTVNGIVEGLGNTVSNLTIDDKQKSGGAIGMFTAVGATGAVNDVRLDNISYSSLDNVVAGGLVGANDGLLCGDHVAGSIRTEDAAGGLAFLNAQSDGGRNMGRILFSSANVSVVAHYDGGGLVVTNEAIILNSHATGDVTTRGVAAGFAARNGGNIFEVYAAGAVSGRLQSAGLVGYNQQGTANPGHVLDSYATGDVKGPNSGGLIGEQDSGSTSTSYSSGAVSGSGGGFICSTNTQHFADDYWDVTTSGAAFGACGNGTIADVAGLTTNELKAGLPLGFDRKVWTHNPKINRGFPYLIDNPPPK